MEMTFYFLFIFIPFLLQPDPAVGVVYLQQDRYASSMYAICNLFLADIGWPFHLR